MTPAPAGEPDVREAVSAGVAGGDSGLPERLSRLLYKYETLAALRRDRASGAPIPEKAVFKKLAGEFPGALHELDRLTMEEIAARAKALREALDGGPAAPWMGAMATYHALYRAALYTKARLAKRQALSDDLRADLARAASRHAGIEVGPAFVSAAANPPAGRIGALVVAEVAARTGEAASDVLRAMFPTRRDTTSRGSERG